MGVALARRRLNRIHTRFQLCSPGGPLGPKVVRLISYNAGEKMVKERKASRIYDPRNNERLVGYLLRVEPAKPVIVRESVPSSAAFSCAEVQAIAGTRFAEGRSRTVGLPERIRVARVSKGLREMDLVEAAQEKLKVYPFVH